MNTEFWGTFSVNDHRRRRAFVADVLLYDRLAVPVPDGDEEWERWVRLGRNPERQRRLIEILGSHAIPVPWTLGLHKRWEHDYEDALKRQGTSAAGGTARARVANALAFDAKILAEERKKGQEPDSLAQGVTRLVLANSKDFEKNVRQIAGLPRTEVESVAAYGSYHHFESQQPYRVNRGRAGHGRPLLMFEWPFVVPSDSELSDEQLLSQAVDLADLEQTSRYRYAFHAWRRDMVLSRVPGLQAMERLEDLASDYRLEMRNIDFKKRSRYGLGIFAAVAGAAAVVFPPAGAVAAVAALGSAVMKTDDQEIDDTLNAGAFLHEARRRLGGK